MLFLTSGNSQKYFVSELSRFCALVARAFVLSGFRFVLRIITCRIFPGCMYGELGLVFLASGFVVRIITCQIFPGCVRGAGFCHF